MDTTQATDLLSSDDDEAEQQDTISVKRKRRDTEVESDQGDRDRHFCPTCNRSFGRIEHMKRHAASHSNDRPFKCSVCEKGFYRLDTMQRHELIHREDTENAKPKGARACTECAVAKVRCSGGSPCTRCATKDSDCRYPEGRGKLENEPTSPNGSTVDIKEPIPRTSQHLFPPRPPMERVNAVPTSVPPFSPSSWDHNAASPSQWFPSNGSIDFSVRSEFQEPPAPRHASFSASQVPPPAIASYSDSYSSLKQSGFVTQPANNAPTPGSVNTTGTRHWLETLLVEPSVIDTRDVGTPGTAVSQRTSSMSETYLDGDGARLPKIGIHRRFNSRPSLPLPSPGLFPLRQPHAPQYGFPHRFCQPDFDNAIRDKIVLDDNTYHDIRRNFERICTVQSSFLPPFDVRNFPSYDHIQAFICMYLDEFQPLCPMLHLPTLDLRSSHWLLPLALAAVGCHFSDSPEAEPCALGLTEYLRRAIMDLQEGGEHPVASVTLAQIKLLCSVGMTYCADERMETQGWRRHLDTIGFCRTHWQINNYEDFTADVQPGDSLDQQWRRWRDVEARRRTGYGIYMLDNMWCYEFDEQNLISLEDCKPPLPCQEVLWEADSALQWQHVRGFSVEMPSLKEATYVVYVEKRVESTMGEFSRILLIHALYSRSWDVTRHLRNPLNHWLPTATKQDLNTIPAFAGPIWLPGEPSYFRWRNATCDCLDILHWRANSVTGAASGVEHPTLLHLHLARIVLLTPIRAICDLVYGLTKQHLNSSAPSTESSIAQNRTIVRRWAEHDQCKARLAMYHAGVLFWHVRLYSAKGFYEPPAVMLAALALWAWGTFAPKSPPVTSPNGDLPDHLGFGGENEAAYPTSINIDRPADDEIVQYYIKSPNMQAMIAGVGDIKSAGGPVRVLIEGAKLSATLSNWGVSRKVMKALTTLANVCQTQSIV